MAELDQHLRNFAKAIGIATSYVGWQGTPVDASATTLAHLLSALGPGYGYALPAQPTLAQVHDASTDFLRRQVAAGAPPVVVAWDGAVVDLGFAVRADIDGDWAISITTEAGYAMPLEGQLFTLPATDHRDFEGAPYCVRHVTFAIGELGYHALTWALVSTLGTLSGSTLIIAAPTKAYVAPSQATAAWGVFAPLYGLKSPWAGGTGDLGTLRHLAHLVDDWGGQFIGTLPLLAGFFAEPCQISPYSPASRMFWNELYLDLADAAKRVHVNANIEVDGYLERQRLFRYQGLDYKAQYAWRRREMNRLAQAAFRSPTIRAELDAWCSKNPDVIDYAAFRTLGETFAAPWGQWPAAWRDHQGFWTDFAALPPEIDRAAVQCHVFAQWMLEQQFGKVGWGTSVGLYLDLPVGVNRDAYEVWRRRELFVLDAGAGAPPDELFLGGQDWGLPPLHPEMVRRDQYRYVIACIREHMRHAAMLRVDHVMGLFRLYCVPAGAAATQGAYIQYQADELLAILCLESHRNRCIVVGEYLGTVPDYVPPAMQRHGLLGLHVGQFAMPSTVGQAPGQPRAATVASLNTHDTATFAGWWLGTDIDDRHALGLIDAARHMREHAERAQARVALLAFAKVDLAPEHPDAAQLAMGAATLHLAASPAEVVLITLEDLWLEAKPQNVPGTSSERANWQRPMARTLQDLGAPGAMLGFTAENSKLQPVDLTVIHQVAALRR